MAMSFFRPNWTEDEDPSDQGPY